MSVVYFIQAGEGGPIKIGRTLDVAKRLVTLQTGHPEPLRILATMPGDAVDELDLHGRFFAARTRGEWFNPVGMLTDFIATLVPFEASASSKVSFKVVGDAEVASRVAGIHQTPAREALMTWLNGRAPAAFAKSIEYDRSNFHKLLNNHKLKPTLDMALRIECATGGTVPVGAWAL